MSQALVPTYHANLPDFLRSPDLFATAEAVAAGIGGGQPPYVSIKAGKFRLVDAGGEEEMVNALTIDLVILGANKHVSKIYYEGDYDLNAAGTPPTCWSDNGQAPSVRAASPQHSNCAGCPQNAWGSAVSKVSGKSIKACQDAKKLAVILAFDTPTMKGGLAGTAKAGAQLYQLRVPATSMRGVADLSKKVTAHGVPLLGCVVKVGFDPQASYPLLTFEPRTYVSREFFQERILPLSQGQEVVEIVGGTDQPRGGQPEPVGTLGGPAASALAAPSPAPIASPPAQPAADPASAPTPTPTAASATTTRKRGRPAGAAPAAASPSPEPSPAAAAAAAGTAAPWDDSPGQAPIQAAGATSPAMDSLLDDIFKGKA